MQYLYNTQYDLEQYFFTQNTEAEKTVPEFY